MTWGEGAGAGGLRVELALIKLTIASITNKQNCCTGNFYNYLMPSNFYTLKTNVTESGIFQSAYITMCTTNSDLSYYILYE